MANRERGGAPNFDAQGDVAPASKVINGRLYEKVPTEFGYAYKPAEAAPATYDAVPVLMSERFSAAIQPSREIIPQSVESEVVHNDSVDQLELALLGHADTGKVLKERLEKARLAEARRIEAEQNAEAMRVYREVIGAHNPPRPSVANPQVDRLSPEHDAYRNEEVSDEQPISVERRKRSRKLMVALGSVGVLGLVAGGVAIAAPNLPGEITAGFLNHDQSSQDKEVKDILPLPSAALVDAFGNCLSENGQGQPLLKLSVTSQTEVSRTYTSSKNVAKVLETNFTDESGALLKANVKPVIITPNAPTAVTACVVEADRGAVITTEGNTVTVDLSKVSPQLYQDIALDQVVRGFPAADSITDPKKDLWPVPTIIAGNVEAGKAKPATDEKMTPEIAASILKDFNDPTTIAAEIRQSQVRTAQALIRPGGGYAEKIKVYLKEGIIAKIKAKADELKKQGLTDVESPNIVFTAETKDIIEKNPEPPKADSFKLADTTQITGFSLQPTPETPTKK